ncbi:MAG: hypothetical protein H0X62_15260 [Bacteroidetes bacterium]|nr:hypothetical protein [Bacteroidota bacterium]
MNDINLHNYEAWFLDYAEGNLDAAQERILLAFLDQNPELKDELDAFDNEVVLSPAINESFDKKSLKAPQADDFDSLLISYLEGQLTETEAKKTEHLIASNPHMSREFSLYKKTVLEPDFAIEFPDKQKLKKGQGKVVRMYWYSAIAAAACLLFFALNFTLNETFDVQNNVATNPIDSILKENSLGEIDIIAPEQIEIIAETNRQMKKPTIQSSEKKIDATKEAEDFIEPLLNGQLALEHDFHQKPDKIEEAQLAANPVHQPIAQPKIISPSDLFADIALPKADGFLSPKEFIINKVKSITRGKSSNEESAENLTAWEIAETGISKISGDKVKIERIQGEHRSGFAFITNKFEFSTSSSR